MIIDINDTPRLLEEWAIRSRINTGSKVGYPSSCPFVIKQGSSHLAITDEEAQQIDAAVARLIHQDKEMGEVLRLHYFNSCNVSLTARKKRIDRKRAYVLIQSGIAWVDAKLDGIVAA